MKDQEGGSAPEAPLRPLNNLVQIAYVTNDIDRAREMLRSLYGIDKWLKLEEMFSRDTVPIEVRDGSVIEIRAAVAYMGGVQFELIQPVVDPNHLYSDFLPPDGAFAIRFHHLGFNQASRQDVQALERTLGHDHAIAMATRSETMPVFYADSRDRLGHYLEYFSLPAEFDAQIPRN